MIAKALRFKVRYQETDRMGIVYHSNYLIWFEMGRTELFNKLGISYGELEKNGYYLVVTEAYCRYKGSATYEDSIELLTKLTEVKNSSMTFDYEVRNKDALITNGTTRHAFLDEKGKVTRIPREVTEALDKHEVSNG